MEQRKERNYLFLLGLTNEVQYQRSIDIYIYITCRKSVLHTVTQRNKWWLLITSCTCDITEKQKFKIWWQGPWVVGYNNKTDVEIFNLVTNILIIACNNDVVHINRKYKIIGCLLENKKRDLFLSRGKNSFEEKRTYNHSRRVCLG